MAALLYYAALTLLSCTHASALTLPALLTSRQSSSNGIYGNGNDGSGVDTNGGASGGKGGSFQLSTGGLIAIIVVVVAVVIFGVATTVLFVMAKRRQWNIRASIRRASRRIAGRDRGEAAENRKSKRAGIQLDSNPGTRQHKRGLVVETEKGQQSLKSKKSDKKLSWTDKFLGSGRPQEIS